MTGGGGGTYADLARRGQLDQEDVANILNSQRVVRVSNDNHQWYIRRHKTGDLQFWMENTSGAYCCTYREGWSLRIIRKYLDRSTQQRVGTGWPGDNR